VEHLKVWNLKLECIIGPVWLFGVLLLNKELCINESLKRKSLMFMFLNMDKVNTEH
jgi:hypothetical protein